MFDFGEDPYEAYLKNEVANSQIESIADANNLYKAYNKCTKGVIWKESTQRYGQNCLHNIRKTQKELRTNTYKPMPMNEFELKERGHDRDIKAHTINDRVIQKSLNDNVLIPSVRNLLIYDNGASLENKGLSFARKRFEIFLRNAFNEYGDNTYVLLIDFSKYFDNIRHQELLMMMSRFLNPAELNFVEICLKEYEIDISYMEPEEILSSMNTIFNSLEYMNIDPSLKTGKEFMRKSIGIGSQLSQISGIYYPHTIDNFCKIVMQCKYYERYMDDTGIFGTKEFLENLIQLLIPKCNELGLFINMKKTRILKVSNNIIPFLKINYFFDKNNSLIRKPNVATFKREYRRLKKFQNKYNEGYMSLEDIIQWYKSWRYTYNKFDSGYEILAMDNHFRKLFPEVDYYFYKRKVRY